MNYRITLILYFLLWSVGHAEESTKRETLRSQQALERFVGNFAKSPVAIQTVSLHAVGSDHWLSLSRTNDLISFSVTISVAGMKNLEKGAVFSISPLDPHITDGAWSGLSESKVDSLKNYLSERKLKLDDNWWTARNEKGAVTSSMRKVIFYGSTSEPELALEAVFFLITRIYESKIESGIEVPVLRK